MGLIHNSRTSPRIPIRRFAMLKVFRITDDEYIVASGKASHYGSLVKTVGTLANLGVADQDIEAGLVSLQLNDHHVAEYGIYKSFIFSVKLK